MENFTAFGYSDTSKNSDSLKPATLIHSSTWSFSSVLDEDKFLYGDSSQFEGEKAPLQDQTTEIVKFSEAVCSDDSLDVEIIKVVNGKMMVHQEPVSVSSNLEARVTPKHYTSDYHKKNDKSNIKKGIGENVLKNVDKLYFCNEEMDQRSDHVSKTKNSKRILYESGSKLRSVCYTPGHCSISHSSRRNFLSPKNLSPSCDPKLRSTHIRRQRSRTRGSRHMSSRYRRKRPSSSNSHSSNESSRFHYSSHSPGYQKGDHRLRSAKRSYRGERLWYERSPHRLSTSRSRSRSPSWSKSGKTPRLSGGKEFVSSLESYKKERHVIKCRQNPVPRVSCKYIGQIFQTSRGSDTYKEIQTRRVTTNTSVPFVQNGKESNVPAYGVKYTRNLNSALPKFKRGPTLPAVCELRQKNPTSVSTTSPLPTPSTHDTFSLLNFWFNNRAYLKDQFKASCLKSMPVVNSERDTDMSELTHSQVGNRRKPPSVTKTEIPVASNTLKNTYKHQKIEMEIKKLKTERDDRVKSSEISTVKELDLQCSSSIKDLQRDAEKEKPVGWKSKEFHSKLQSETLEKKSLDKSKEMTSNFSKEDIKTLSVKGVEFIKPLHMFYCSLCRKILSNESYVKFHAKESRHIEKYKVFLKENPASETKCKNFKESSTLSLRCDEKAISLDKRLIQAKSEEKETYKEIKVPREN